MKRPLAASATSRSLIAISSICGAPASAGAACRAFAACGNLPRAGITLRGEGAPVTCSPTPGSLSTSIRPRAPSAMVLAMQRPSPVPPASRERAIIHTVEPLEDARKRLRWNADSRVAHGDFQPTRTQREQGEGKSGIGRSLRLLHGLFARPASRLVQREGDAAACGVYFNRVSTDSRDSCAAAARPRADSGADVLNGHLDRAGAADTSPCFATSSTSRSSSTDLFPSAARPRPRGQHEQVVHQPGHPLHFFRALVQNPLVLAAPRAPERDLDLTLRIVSGVRSSWRRRRRKRRICVKPGLQARQHFVQRPARRPSSSSAPAPPVAREALGPDSSAACVIWSTGRRTRRASSQPRPRQINPSGASVASAQRKFCARGATLRATSRPAAP